MRRTKADAEETRRKILDAAELVFLERGVSHTSLEQIAAAADVTRGAIYWHFKNKVELFRALVERARFPQEEILKRAVETNHPDPLSVLENGALEALSALIHDEQKRRLYTIMTTRCEYVGEMSAALERQRLLKQDIKNTLRRGFAIAQSHGDLSPEWTLETASTTLECMMAGIFFEWIRYGDNDDFVRRAEICIRKLFQSFRHRADLINMPLRKSEASSSL